MGAVIPWVLAAAQVAGTVSSISAARKAEKRQGLVAGQAQERAAQKIPDIKGAQAAAEKEAEDRRRRKVSPSTILTGPQGVLNEAPVTRKALLGT